MRSQIVVCGALALLPACSGQSPTTGSRDHPDAAPSPMTSSDGGAGDPNRTIATAVPITVGDFPGTLDMIEGREDVDFFSFEGKSGQWVTIRSTGNSAAAISNTALALFGPDEQPLAWNHSVSSLLGENILARITTRLPQTGTYYVGVGDVSAPTVSLGLVTPYRISVTDLAATEGFVVNDEVGSGADGATSVAFKSYPIPGEPVDDAFVVGDFSSRDDVDVFSFEVPTGTAKLVNAHVEKGTTSGNGSTTTAGRVWVTDESGASIIGRIDNSTGQSALDPPLPAGRYLLWVAHPDAPVGDNDFYVIRAMLASDNPAETEEATNGAIASAEPLTVEKLDPAGAHLQAYLVAHVTEKDIDYFRFDGTPGQTASVYCSSVEDGSGLVGFHVAARDAADTTLAEGTETSQDPVSLDSITIPSSGALYVRASKDAQLPDVVGDWVRCAVTAN